MTKRQLCSFFFPSENQTPLSIFIVYYEVAMFSAFREKPGGWPGREVRNSIVVCVCVCVVSVWCVCVWCVCVCMCVCACGECMCVCVCVCMVYVCVCGECVWCVYVCGVCVCVCVWWVCVVCVCGVCVCVCVCVWWVCVVCVWCVVCVCVCGVCACVCVCVCVCVRVCPSGWVYTGRCVLHLFLKARFPTLSLFRLYRTTGCSPKATFLTLQPRSTVPPAAMTPNHTIIFEATS
jgi:hypothetical protein